MAKIVNYPETVSSFKKLYLWIQKRSQLNFFCTMLYVYTGIRGYNCEKIDTWEHGHLWFENIHNFCEKCFVFDVWASSNRPLRCSINPKMCMMIGYLVQNDGTKAGVSAWLISSSFCPLKVDPRAIRHGKSVFLTIDNSKSISPRMDITAYLNAPHSCLHSQQIS